MTVVKTTFTLCRILRQRAFEHKSKTNLSEQNTVCPYFSCLEIIKCSNKILLVTHANLPRFNSTFPEVEGKVTNGTSSSSLSSQRDF